jgi:hypothetical protein
MLESAVQDLTQSGMMADNSLSEVGSLAKDLNIRQSYESHSSRSSRINSRYDDNESTAKNTV